MLINTKFLLFLQLKNKNSRKKFFLFFIYWDLKPWLFDWLLKFYFILFLIFF